MSVTVNGPTQVTVTWSATTGATYYYLAAYLNEAAPAPAALKAGTGAVAGTPWSGSATTHVFTGLSAGTLYYFYNVAEAWAGTLSAISVFYFATTTAPTPPTISCSSYNGTKGNPTSTVDFNYTVTVYAGYTLSGAVYSLVWPDDVVVGEATTVSNTALTGPRAITVGLIYGGTTVMTGQVKIKALFTLSTGAMYAYYSPLFYMTAPVLKYTVNVGTFPVTASGVSTTSVTIGGETFTATTAIPPQYGTISGLFNGGGFYRSTDTVFYVATGLYRGDAAWAGGMITTTTTTGGINGPWIQMQFSGAKTITEVGWKTSSADAPKTWYIMASNTGGNDWINLGNDSRAAPIPDGTSIVTTVSNTTAYTYYRVVVTAVCGGTGGIQSTLLIESTFYFKGF
jgi:hypothetical protein